VIRRKPPFDVLLLFYRIVPASSSFLQINPKNHPLLEANRDSIIYTYIPYQWPFRQAEFVEIIGCCAFLAKLCKMLTGVNNQSTARRPLSSDAANPQNAQKSIKNPHSGRLQGLIRPHNTTRPLFLVSSCPGQINRAGGLAILLQNAAILEGLRQNFSGGVTKEI
jgi:hypothetical protein